MIAIFPEIIDSVKTGDIELIAVTVRRYFASAQKSTPLVNLESLFDELGVSKLAIERSQSPSIVAKDERGRISICLCHHAINPKSSKQRFLLAHQLGHIILDMMPSFASSEWKTSGFCENVDPLERFEGTKNLNGLSANEQERQREARADGFAAALLMPKGMFKKACTVVKTDQQLADFFGTTVTGIQRRRDMIEGSMIEPSFYLTPVPPPPFIATTNSAQPARLSAQTDRKLSDIKEKHAYEQANLRSVVAGSYGQSERMRSDSKKADVDSNRRTSSTGMERLREIARQIDKGL